MEDITFEMTRGKFNVRVAALIVHEGKILVMRDDAGDYFYLPGGRITLHETSGDAMRREILEELNETVSSPRLRWVVENYFYEKHQKMDFHEICFFYECKLNHDSKVLSCTEFETEERGRVNHFQWIPVQDLEVANVVPSFLKERLGSADGGLQHFVFHQDRRGPPTERGTEVS